MSQKQIIILSKVMIVALLSAQATCQTEKKYLNPPSSFFVFLCFFLLFIVLGTNLFLFNRTASATLSAVIGTEGIVWEWGALGTASTDMSLKGLQSDTQK